MGIENIFKSRAAHSDAMEKARVRQAMSDYASSIADAVDTIGRLEALLSRPCPERREGFTSSLTMQPIPDYYPTHCIRVVFDNKTGLPIGAELIESMPEDGE